MSRKQVPSEDTDSGRVSSNGTESGGLAAINSKAVELPKPSDVLIAVMGITGSGKSTLISKLVGMDIGIGHNLESCTSEIGIYSFMYDDTRRVFLVDTPGFDDTNRSDTDVLKDIAYYLSETYKSGLKLAGIIYLHRITDVRMAGSALNNLKMFKALCGEGSDVFKHIVLATTMWENLNGPGLSRAEGEKRQKELIERKDWWGMMYQRGSQVYECRDDEDSAMSIVSYLVGLRTQTVLNIQKEMIEDQKSLENTSAGQEVEKELQELKQRHEEDLVNLEAEKQEALAEKDQELLEELSKQFEETNRKLIAAAQAQSDLKIDFQRLEMEQQVKYRQMLEEQTVLQQEKTREMERRMEQRLADEKRASEQKERQMEERRRVSERRFEEEIRKNEERAAERAELRDEEYRQSMRSLQETMAEDRRQAREDLESVKESERSSMRENRMVLRERSVSISSRVSTPYSSPSISEDDRCYSSENKCRGNADTQVVPQTASPHTTSAEGKATAGPGAVLGIVAMLAGAATLNPVLMSIGAGAAATSALGGGR